MSGNYHESTGEWIFDEDWDTRTDDDEEESDEDDED